MGIFLNSARVRAAVTSTALAAGVVLVILFSTVGSARAAWSHLAGLLSGHTASATVLTQQDLTQLDRQNPQAQAESLLDSAVNQVEGAGDQIASRANRWRGKLNWDAQLGILSNAALNSSDLRVRAAAIEVELAAYGLAKSSSSVDQLVTQAASADHARKIWALWTLGLIANRGVDPVRVVQVLSGHLKDSDEDSRRWTVEALALVGTSPAIAPLLRAMRDDPSPVVRQHAASGLAQSGMLSPEQRRSAVPQLLRYSDDPALDARTHDLSFQALSDITRQRLPNDSAAWRNWYQNSGGN
jgi:HEAT repeat protein